MSANLDITFGKIEQPKKETVIGFKYDDQTYTQIAADLNDELDGLIVTAAEMAAFKGKKKSSVDLLAPGNGAFRRVLIMGLGKIEDYDDEDWSALGGRVFASLKKTDSTVIVCFDIALKEDEASEKAAELAFGMVLRSYKFDKYKSKKAKAENGDDKENGNGSEEVSLSHKITIQCADPAKARKHFASLKAIADGIFLARDLVNEPPNVLTPIEFANHAKALEELGVDVEILDDKALKKLKMNALLGVGQGSANPSRVAVMHWSGARKKSESPVAFIGKGVTFDTGGISIKPAAGMEDMKGDMAGAACVVGLMKALAGRKAKVNAIGVIGLVENMPGSNAQRPGDIVTSMSGQTIEIINTDAEGRLVLADILWYTQDKYKPKFMINLATLTGAILIALGTEYAGLFSNDDELAEHLEEAGEYTGERVWRLPMGPDYDKMIDSKFADMKNTGGRNAGSITAAQFLQRFVNDVPWAHLDIAGTGMASPKSDINESWGSGFGVRLLDHLVAEYYED